MQVEVKKIERRSGFILLESILALALFAIVAVGFTVAIQQVAFTANRSGESMRIQRVLETLLTEASKVVRFEEVEEGGSKRLMAPWAAGYIM